MRSDFALYVIAIVFFILTGVVVAYSVEQQLWIVTTAVLGLVFIGLGYTQRPKQMVSTETAPTLTSPPPPPSVSTSVKEEPKKEQVEKTTEPQMLPSGLTQVKGIKEKRAQQLKAIGINSIEDLANASTDDIAAKLQVSPKITGRWIETAKELAKKP